MFLRCLQMIDDSILPAVGGKMPPALQFLSDADCLIQDFFSAGLAGIAISAGFVSFMERAAVKSAAKIDEKVRDVAEFI